MTFGALQRVQGNPELVLFGILLEGLLLKLSDPGIFFERAFGAALYNSVAAKGIASAITTSEACREHFVEFAVKTTGTNSR